MPGNDIVGFEYEAKQESDVEKVENAISILSEYTLSCPGTSSVDTASHS